MKPLILSRKQLKAVLDILKVNLKGFREGLAKLVVKDGYWIATNGYILVIGKCEGYEGEFDYGTLAELYASSHAGDIVIPNTLSKPLGDYPDIKGLLTKAKYTETNARTFDPKLVSQALKLTDEYFKCCIWEAAGKPIFMFNCAPQTIFEPKDNNIQVIVWGMEK